MTDCFWPCCSESYNIRRYDRDGSVIWSQTILDGNTVGKIKTFGTDYVYALAPFTGVNDGLHIAKYDITSTPSEVWGKTFAQIKAFRSAETYFNITDIAIDTSGDVACIVQGSNGVNPQNGKFVMKLSGDDGSLMWVRELKHTMTSVNARPALTWSIYPTCIACGSGDVIYLGHNPIRYAYVGPAPTYSFIQYINMTALNPDSSTRWQVSSDLQEAVAGYPSTYQPPQITTIEAELTVAVWGCSVSPFASPPMKALGAVNNSGTAVWDDEVGGTIGLVVSSPDAAAFETLIHTQRISNVYKWRTRRYSTGLLTDTITATSGRAVAQRVAARKVSSSVARAVFVEGTGLSVIASIWEDAQSGSSVYTKVIDLEYGDILSQAITDLQVAYIHKAATDDDVLVAGQLINA